MDFDGDGTLDLVSGSYDPGELYLFRGQASHTAVLSFSVGEHIAIVVLNVLLGITAVLLTTRTLRLRRLREQAAADEAAAATQGAQSEPR